jgi:hypothetical protein
MRLADRQDDEFARLGLDWRDLFGRPLHAIDAQGLGLAQQRSRNAAVRLLEARRIRGRRRSRRRPC